MIAAFLAGVPGRLYTLHGLPLATASGLKRVLLRWTEKVSCLLAHRVVAVGPSLRRAALEETLASEAKIRVLGPGSINGVDAAGRFDPSSVPLARRIDFRDGWRIPRHARVVGYVGRLVRDKGLETLVGAWHALREEFPDLHLLVVGPFEPQDPLSPEVERILRDDPRIRLTGEIRDVREAYAVMDVVVLPSYREGFPLVPLEAAAMEIPVVATRVTGCVDAVEDGRTGTIVPPGEAAPLQQALRNYLLRASLRRAHGRAGRERVLSQFKPEQVWEGFRKEYDDLLRLRGGVRAGGKPPRERPGRAPRPVDVLLKRLIDVGAAAAGLVVLGPILAAVAIAIRVSMGRPVFFRQRRPGLRGRPYTLLKFRTMRGGGLPDEQRTTRLGALLRATSLDELPQLWNVLRGEMSLVGPRPLLMSYLDRYSEEQARRHEVKPGITGWSQVKGRNSLTWEEKFAHDLWYVDHWNLGFDLKILLLTVGRVLSRSGINGPGNAAMPEFMGNGREGRGLQELKGSST
jgi:lipopolysaccharide/colanic/teichoic acid biosynthesis glycosyltransferase